MSQIEVKSAVTNGVNSAEAVKIRSPKPNRRSSSFFNIERNGRLSLKIVWPGTSINILPFKTDAGAYCYRWSWTVWQVLHHQTILWEEVCGQVSSNCWDRLWSNQDIRWQEGGEQGEILTGERLLILFNRSLSISLTPPEPPCLLTSGMSSTERLTVCW